jgi:HTH-type transcriptional regulator/antitoxin HigA
MSDAPIRPLRSRALYEAAVAEIDRLIDAGDDTPDGERLEVLAVLVEAYERRHFPIRPLSPIDAILAALDRTGLKRADLEPAIGHSGRVSEVLNRRRRLTLPMIHKLSAVLNVSIEVLAQPYALQKPRRLTETLAPSEKAAAE